MPETVSESLLRWLARRYANHNAPYEDLLQEAHIAVWLAERDYNEAAGASLKTYLTRRAKGAILHYLRDKAPLIAIPAYLQEKGMLPEPLASLDAPGIGLERLQWHGDEGEEETEGIAWEKVLPSLPPVQRLTLELMLEGYNYKEIARKRGCCLGSVKCAMEGGVKNLQRLLLP